MMMNIDTNDDPILARESFRGLPLCTSLKGGTKRLTKALFYETFNNMPIEQRRVVPPYTLHVRIDGLINFGEEYVSLQDQTGYKMAQKHLGGDYGHWELLMKQSWFKEAKAKWDRELDAKIHSEAVEAIQSIARGEGATALQAAKFLAQKGFKMAPSDKGRGRPSKEEMEGHIKNQLAEDQEVLNDLQRIRVVN